MSTLIILRGNSASGKSSAAGILQKQLGANTLLISQDRVRHEMLWTPDGKDTKALPLMITLLQYGENHCEHVILEGILYAEWYGPLFEEAIRLFGTGIFAYYYDISFEETLKRHQTREKRFEFGEESLRKWWREKDFLESIPEKVFREDVSLDDAVKRILADIGNQR